MQPDPKRQQGDPQRPEGLPDDVIVSPDTRREERLPPNQVRTYKWPVLDAFGTPRIDEDSWRFRVDGLVERPLELSHAEFLSLPRVRVFSDFHCVTRWSRLGNLWEGLSARELLERVRPRPEARFVLAVGADEGTTDGRAWTTNLPLADFDEEDVLLASHHDGEPIPPEHGGPVRLVVPRLYAWKSAKWCVGLRFLASDERGFWERGGYHDRGDPWSEQRFR